MAQVPILTVTLNPAVDVAPVVPHVVAGPKLRLDAVEAADAAGRALASFDDMIALARQLIARGVALSVVIGRGAEGSLMVAARQACICHPPTFKERSKIGAGRLILLNPPAALWLIVKPNTKRKDRTYV